jgi:hypothetical protein
MYVFHIDIFLTTEDCEWGLSYIGVDVVLEVKLGKSFEGGP